MPLQPDIDYIESNSVLRHYRAIVVIVFYSFLWSAVFLGRAIEIWLDQVAMYWALEVMLIYITCRNVLIAIFIIWYWENITDNNYPVQHFIHKLKILLIAWLEYIWREDSINIA